MTPPVTSSCFVNLVLTLLPWGLSTEMCCIDVPALVASAAGACKSPLHGSHNIQLVQKARHGKEMILCFSELNRRLIKNCVKLWFYNPIGHLSAMLERNCKSNCGHLTTKRVKTLLGCWRRSWKHHIDINNWCLYWCNNHHKQHLYLQAVFNEATAQMEVTGMLLLNLEHFIFTWTDQSVKSADRKMGGFVFILRADSHLCPWAEHEGAKDVESTVCPQVETPSISYPMYPLYWDKSWHTQTFSITFRRSTTLLE